MLLASSQQWGVVEGSGRSIYREITFKSDSILIHCEALTWWTLSLAVGGYTFEVWPLPPTATDVSSHCPLSTLLMQITPTSTVFHINWQFAPTHRENIVIQQFKYSRTEKALLKVFENTWEKHPQNQNGALFYNMTQFYALEPMLTKDGGIMFSNCSSVRPVPENLVSQECPEAFPLGLQMWISHKNYHK